MSSILRLLRVYWSWRPFTEHEAWQLFKIAAIAEAVGWSLLIVGIFLRDVVLHGNQAPVQLAGRIHGSLFLLYILAVLILAPSLGWSWFKTMCAGLCSVPPYGSLLFERFAAYTRKIAAVHFLHKRLRFMAALRTPEG